MQWLLGCVVFPFSPETKFPACIFHKAPGWWLFHEALWPASLRRGFCSWELDPQRLTKLQLQRGYYINVPKLKHYPFFFLFPETSSFSGFVRQTNFFPAPPPLSRSRPLPTIKKATESLFSSAIFKASGWLWGERAAPLRWVRAQRRAPPPEHQPQLCWPAPRPGKPKLLLLRASLPIPSCPRARGEECSSSVDS